MREMLVSTPAGAGVARAEHGLLVTHDVSEGGGTYLRDADRFQPVKSWFDEDRSVVGGCCRLARSAPRRWMTAVSEFELRLVAAPMSR